MASAIEGPSLEFVFVVLVGGTLDGDLVDHVASAHERGHLVERRFADRQTADAGRSEHLVGRNREEIHVKFGDVNPRVGRACAASSSTRALRHGPVR